MCGVSSTLAYLCYNRGVQLIGANRAAPFSHMVPLFGSAMALVFLDERPQLFTSSVRPGADRRFRRLAKAA